MNTTNRLAARAISDPVDALLKIDAEALHADYIDDAGFTLAVMDELPKRRNLPSWVRHGLPVGLAALAATFAFVFAGGDVFFIDASMDIATGSPTRAALGFCVLVAILIGAAVQTGKAR